MQALFLFFLKILLLFCHATNMGIEGVMLACKITIFIYRRNSFDLLYLNFKFWYTHSNKTNDEVNIHASCNQGGDIHTYT